MVTTQPHEAVWMRDETNALAAWLKADLSRRYDAPNDLPLEFEYLIEQICQRG